MSVVGSDSVRMGASGIASYGYEIANSLRFDDGASQYLSRVSSSADADRTKAVVSVWLKRGALTGRHTIYAINSAGSVGASNQISMSFENAGTNGDTLNYYNGSVNRTSTRVFRDPAAHLHFCQIFDTTQATQADRVKTYINGVLIDDLNIAQDFSLSANTAFGQASVTEYIGRGDSGFYFDGLLDGDLIFTVGQDATIDDFGEFDATNPAIWRPKSVSGLTFGTNGFHLDFENGAGLGNDVSGNANTWTVNNTPVQSVDTPTNNHITFSSISKNTASGALTDGNTANTSSNYATGTTQAFPQTGIWQVDFEVEAVSGTNGIALGIADLKDFDHRASDGSYSDGYGPFGLVYTFNADGTKTITSASSAAYGSNWFTVGKVVSLIYHADVGALYCAIDGTLQNSATGAEIEAGTTTNALTSSLSGHFMPIMVGHNTGNRMRIIAPDADLQAISGLNAAKGVLHRNFPDPEVADPQTYLSVVAYAGDSVSPRTLDTGMDADLAVLKRRNTGGNGYDWTWWDTVRGVNASVNTALSSNATDAEGLGGSLTTSTQFGGVSAFGTTDVTLLDGSVDARRVNETGNYVGLFLKELPGFFDIVGYTGDGVAGRNISHSLGVAPELLIGKPRTGTNNWVVGSEALTSWANRLVLNGTSAQATDTAAFDSTAPDASNFRVSTTLNANTVTQIAYLFATMSGICMVGTYTGNGSADGPVVYCGGRPLYVVCKTIDSANGWVTLDRERSPENVADDELYWQSANAESSGSGAFVDFLGTGFKVRSTAGSINTGSTTYIFIAFLDGSVGGELTPPAPAQ